MMNDEVISLVAEVLARTCKVLMNNHVFKFDGKQKFKEIKDVLVIREIHREVGTAEYL